jgi:15-cis-phytoene synthase
MTPSGVDEFDAVRGAGTPGADGRAASQHDPEARAVMARVARTFHLATWLLPREVRVDVRRLYLVLRSLDDAVDHDQPDAWQRVEAVEAWARDESAAGREVELLDDLARRHPDLPRDAIRDFCAGMRADLAGPRHATDDELATYCYQVAGTVGRLMAVLIGVRPGHGPRADASARALGRAMQRTNILRDVTEDARAGRIYLPDTDLRAAGLDPADRPVSARAIAGLPAWPADRRKALLGPHIARADADYAIGLAGVTALVRGRRGIVAAGRLYREILRTIERDRYGGAGRRAVVSRPRKAAIVLRVAIRGR